MCVTHTVYSNIYERVIKNVNIENDSRVSSIINSKEKVDLTFYCRDNIPRYQTISSIPKNHIEYFKSILPINMDLMLNR